MTSCTICEVKREPGAAECGNCGAPADERAESGAKLECRLCDGVLWSLAETCVHCGARGYPALRARLGDKSEGAPE